jgi:hypothetical protein
VASPWSTTWALRSGGGLGNSGIGGLREMDFKIHNSNREGKGGGVGVI